MVPLHRCSFLKHAAILLVVLLASCVCGQSQQTCPPGQGYEYGYCGDCYSGKYQTVDEKGVPICADCPQNTYQDQIGQTTCKSCPPGSLTYYNGSSGCEPCMPSYQPGYNENGYYECIPCPDGFYTPYEGAAPCTRCPTGSFISDGYQNNSCVQCPAGTAAVNATGPAAKCYPDASDYCCPPCEPGSFTSSPGSLQCQLCPAGTYQPDSKQTGCLPCPAGSYSAAPGAPKCTNTSVGYYQDLTGQSTQKACPAGTVGLVLGGTTMESACKPFVAGRYSYMESQHKISILKVQYSTYALDSIGTPVRTVMDSTTSRGCGGDVYSQETWYTCTRYPYINGVWDISSCFASQPSGGQLSSCLTYDFYALADGGFAWVLHVNETAEPVVCLIPAGQTEVSCQFRGDAHGFTSVNGYTGEWLSVNTVAKADGEPVTPAEAPGGEFGGIIKAPGNSAGNLLSSTYAIIMAAVATLFLLNVHSCDH